ncbi:mitochondrial ribonuclease P catalytic subunit isoform X2 [Pristis pectinata]|uniref:mitochondrial ribonuclease P catalytic subunit isoform X2 n=1 Tax=Pristis pectinata TaxID=685728 RepID=UPI00223D72F9|nr:mitochondrial ribonuclease P catalytic subunit isoform X2 [Pristis pectinata]
MLPRHPGTFVSHLKCTFTPVVKAQGASRLLPCAFAPWSCTSSKFLTLSVGRQHDGNKRDSPSTHRERATRRGATGTSFSLFTAGAARKRAELAKSKLGNKLIDVPKEANTPKTPIPIKPLSIDDWKKMKAEAYNKTRFEVSMMEKLLSNHADIDIAKSLLVYVTMETGTVGYELLLKYLALCVQGHHLNEVLDLYAIMKTKFETLDTGAYSLFISGFSKTDRWKEAVIFLDSIKKMINPSPRNYGDVIISALQHKEVETAWRLLNEMEDRNLKPNEDTLQAFFDCGKSSCDEQYENMMMNILSYLRDNQIYPGESLMRSIQSWFESGECHICKTLLESIQLNEEEYNILKECVMNDVIQGKDVFKKTTPMELQHFQSFVKNRLPFDVVIDGLNVANISAKDIQSKILLEVVSHLAQQNLRLLVLGRQHMLRGTRSWDKGHMTAIQKYADCFFTSNISEDDPFLLYATILSGNHCKFLSRDLMRDHKACLSDKNTRRLFFKWQRGHQLVLSGYNPGRKMKFEVIPKYDTIVQSTKNTWHIPYEEEGMERCSYEVPCKWLCLQKRN